MKRVTGGSLPAEIWVRFMRKAIEEDKGFERELPKVTAFPANPREDAREVNLASNVITPRAVSQPKPQPQRKRQGLFGSSRDKSPKGTGVA